METVKIDIDVVNKLRYALDAHIKEANEAVNRLVEREMISGSNDFMMAQYALIAGYYWAMGESELGRAFIKKVKEFSEYAADRTSLIDAYILIGNYETIDDVFDEALTWYFKALDLSLAIDDNKQIARIYNNIGFTFHYCGDSENGLIYLLKAEDHAKPYSEYPILSTLYNNIVEILLEKADYEEAKRYLDLMDLVLHDDRSLIFQLNYQINKWRYLLAIKDEEYLETVSKEVKHLMEKLPYGNDYVLCSTAIFDILVQMGESDEAVNYLEKDIAFLKDIKSYNYLKKYYDKLIDYYEKNDNVEERLKYLESSYQNDLSLERARKAQQLRVLERVNLTYGEGHDKSEKTALKYSALNDENLRLLATNNNLRAIHDIGVRILSTTDLEEIYDILISKVDAFFKLEEFAIGVYDKNENALVFKHSSHKDISQKETALISMTCTNSLSVKCFNENREIVLNDCQAEDPERYERNMKRGERLQSMLFFPIEVNGKPFGVMTFQDEQKNAFSSLHIEVFRLLATFISVSFNNAHHNMKLRKEIEKRTVIQNELEETNIQLDYLAKHDGLTGVYNRRTFEKVYGKAFENAKLNGENLTVMILDIDYFKEYNDHYGHLNGDKCIINIVNILRKTVNRSEDFIARYGGDEFMILLHDSNRQYAEYIADKLVQAVRNEAIPHEGSPIAEVVTVSLGVVSRRVKPDDKSDALLIIADNALYQTKKKLGRDAFYLL